VRKFPSLFLLPGALAIYSVVHSIFFRRGLDSLRLPTIALTALVILIYAYGLVLLFRRAQPPLNLLFASLVLTMTLFYGYFRDEVIGSPAIASFVRSYFWNKNNTFFILLAFLVSLGAGWIFKSRREASAKIGTFALVFVSALMIMDIVVYYQGRPGVHVIPPEYADTIRAGKDKPDVYFLIFDSETSPSSLRRYWGYQNDSVQQALRQRGFFVGTHNRSNYNLTPYSIASTLNMNYLSGYSADTFGEEFPQSITSGVMNIFASNGYTVHNLSFLTVNGLPKLGSVIQYTIWDKTLFYFLVDRAANYTYTTYRALHSNLLATMLDSLALLTGQKNAPPKFVYAHFFVPHTPAFIDEKGTLKPSGVMDAQDMGGYLGQAVYSHRLMLRLADTIREASNGAAIIIIQGDHGYRFLEGPQKMAEQFDILSAFYFPNRDYSLLTDSTRSVNTFRIVFDSEFGAKLPLLKDSSFNALSKLLNTLR
jgi:hypothetical protein